MIIFLITCKRLLCKRRLNSTQNPGMWLGCSAHSATGLCAPGGGMGYPWYATCWGHQAIIWKTWPQIIVVHHDGKDATFLARLRTLLWYYIGVEILVICCRRLNCRTLPPLPISSGNKNLSTLLSLCPIPFFIS